MLEARTYTEEAIFRATELFRMRTYASNSIKKKEQFVENVLKGKPVWWFRFLSMEGLFCGTFEELVDACAVFPFESEMIQRTDITDEFMKMVEEAAIEQEKGVRDDS